MMNYLEPCGNIMEKRDWGGKEGEGGWDVIDNMDETRFQIDVKI
jgi:hypothetical protein